MSYCERCGTRIPDNGRFCSNCGWDSQSNKTNKEKILNKLSGYVGNNVFVDLNWKCLFSDVLKKHSISEAETLFATGTPQTTPSKWDISTSWPKPWLYARVFVAFLTAYFLLLVVFEFFYNANALPGMIIVGSFRVPIATLVLFFELNAYQNISFFRVIQTFLVGGCASLVATLALFSLVKFNGELDFVGAMVVGVVEEVGKLVIIFYFLKRMDRSNTILCAMLVGAAVGAGFAAFESAGYAFNILLSAGYEEMKANIILRGFFAPGGHVAWSAISGAALAIASKGGGLEAIVFGSLDFWKIFIIPVVLHAVWDMPLGGLIKAVSLVVIVWVIALVIVNYGLKELKNNILNKNNTT